MIGWGKLRLVVNNEGRVMAKKTVTTFGGPVPAFNPAEIYPGQIFTVKWSNGAGFTEYRMVDNPGSGPHLLEVIREQEYVA